MSINLGPYANFHEINLDWLIKEWYETKEALVGDQHQWQEFKENMNKEWEAFHTALTKEQTDFESKINGDFSEKSKALDVQFANFEKTANTKIDDQNTAIEDLKKYCQNYFANLNLQAEVGKKIDEMSLNGSLFAIMQDEVDDIVQQWLNTNIKTGSTVIDKTFSLSNASPDSKETGNLAFLSRTTLDLINNEISPGNNNKVTNLNQCFKPGVYYASQSALEGVIESPGIRNMVIVFASSSGMGNIRDNRDLTQMIFSSNSGYSNLGIYTRSGTITTSNFEDLPYGSVVNISWGAVVSLTATTDTSKLWDAINNLSSISIKVDSTQHPYADFDEIFITGLYFTDAENSGFGTIDSEKVPLNVVVLQFSNQKCVQIAVKIKSIPEFYVRSYGIDSGWSSWVSSNAELQNFKDSSMYCYPVSAVYGSSQLDGIRKPGIYQADPEVFTDIDGEAKYAVVQSTQVSSVAWYQQASIISNSGQASLAYRLFNGTSWSVWATLV